MTATLSKVDEVEEDLRHAEEGLRDAIEKVAPPECYVQSKENRCIKKFERP